MSKDTRKIFVPADPIGKPVVTTQKKAVISYTITVNQGDDMSVQTFSDSLQVDCIASLRQCPSDYRDKTARTMADKFYEVVRGFMN